MRLRPHPHQETFHTSCGRYHTGGAGETAENRSAISGACLLCFGYSLLSRLPPPRQCTLFVALFYMRACPVLSTPVSVVRLARVSIA
jgi:hypothetical protein